MKVQARRLKGKDYTWEVGIACPFCGNIFTHISRQSTQDDVDCPHCHQKIYLLVDLVAHSVEVFTGFEEIIL